MWSIYKSCRGFFTTPEGFAIIVSIDFYRITDGLFHDWEKKFETLLLGVDRRLEKISSW